MTWRYVRAVNYSFTVVKTCVHHLCLGLLAAALVCTAQAQAHSPPWNTGANDVPWVWDDSAASPFGSLPYDTSKYDVRILLKKEKHGGYFITFLDGEREVFTIHGHHRTVFATCDNRLYYGEFGTSSSGAEIVAVDLETGKQLWKSSVLGIGPVTHFAYTNALTLRAHSKGVMVYGNEALGQYFEVKDPDTGVTIAHRLFTREETDPVAGGVRKALERYHEACRWGGLPEVKRYLEAGLDVNARFTGLRGPEHGSTALLLAIESGSPLVVQYLLDYGHAMTPRTGDLKTPFDIAVDSAVKAAVSKPADAKLPVERVTGLTKLQGALKCSLLLLQHGAPTTPAALTTLRPIAQAAGDAELLRALDLASTPKPASPASRP